MRNIFIVSAIASISFGMPVLAADEGLPNVPIETMEYESMDGFIEFYRGSTSFFELTPYKTGEECRGASWEDLQNAIGSDDNREAQIQVKPCGENVFICLDTDETPPFTPNVCGTYSW